MASTYVNNLRLDEMATGDGSGTWGVTTNTNLTLIGEAFGYATKAIADASTATLTIPDGTETDSEPRAMYLKLTGGGQACTVTLAPNTASKVWIIENVTSYTLTFTQGSGANVAILAGETKMLATDGAGSGAVVYDVLTDTNLAGTTKTAALTNAGALSNQGTLTVGVDDTGYDVKLFGATSGNYMLWDESADSLLVNGDIDMVTNGNRIDLDTDNDTSIRASADDTITIEVGGSDLIALTSTSTFSCPLTVGVNDTGHDVNFFGATSGQKVFWDESADTLYQTCTVDIDGTVTVGVDDTGYDVKFFGATASAYMLWDESADDLILAGAARVVVPASGLVIGSTAVTSTAAELNLLDGLDRGSILYGNASSATTVLGQGSADQVLTSDGTDIAWADASGGGISGLTGLVENNSIWLGSDPSGTTDTASKNVALGTTALDSITTADDNTAIGYASLTAITTGSYNTAVGVETMDACSTGGENTAVGQVALGALTTGNYNVAVGAAALDACTTGASNTGVGLGALGATTTASNNTAVGAQALDANSTGAENTGMGLGALGANTTASHNTAMGSGALGAATTGQKNIAIGNEALDALTTETGNTAIGYQALTTSHTNGTNTAVGYQAGSAVTDGASNNLFGYQCGDAITTGYSNDCFGSHSMDTSAAITGYGNACFGGASMRDVTTGQQNTGVGNANLANLTTGSTNTAIGFEALKTQTTANANTAVGMNAGLNVTTGENNLFLGFTAGITGSPGGNITTASNEFGLGDENISAANIQVDWTIASDERDKTDFTALDLGLSFVNSLAPLTYKWDKRSKYGDKTADGYDLNAQTPDGTHKEDWLDIGFKAQAVNALEEAAGYKIADKKNLTVNLTGDGKQYGLQYSKFIPILVKALQEADDKIDALTTRIEALEG